jgi:predicted phage tail component-like protein
MNGMTFNNKHSFRDMGLIMGQPIISPPEPKIIIEDVPFMNGSYDFSTVGTNGEVVYSNRDIAIPLTMDAPTKAQLYIKYSQILEWLMGVEKSNLIFDFMPDLYFVAKVTQKPSWEELSILGKITAQFLAEPFMYDISLAGYELWDTFNFVTGVLQNTLYNVIGTININIINPGHMVIPIIKCSSAMTVTLRDKIYNFTAGDNINYDFKLWTGDNVIAVTGNGTIEFTFRRQVL